jgi:hypothetical protein
VVQETPQAPSWRIQPASGVLREVFGMSRMGIRRRLTDRG